MKLQFGNRRLIGQHHARQKVERVVQSGRTSHAYLFTGPEGSGKTAFALAFAEVLNGIDHLTDLGEATLSRKSGWFSHPDIHVYIPLPKAVADSTQARATEMKNRLQLLREDPYDIVDFRLRPVIDSESGAKNRQAFYPIDYFREEIRPKCSLKPNEGRYTVVVITQIESMREVAANAFLKLLEEPPDNVIFLLTCSNTDKLLPTIVSRCQHIRLNTLSEKEVAGALEKHDGIHKSDALFLARLSGGNYSQARFYDLELMKNTRDDVIRFLRMAYLQDAKTLITIIQDWQSKLNTENQIELCNILETVLRDLMVYRETSDETLLVNIDQLEVIHNFCKSLEHARIQEMITHLQSLKTCLYQNVQFKYIFTVLAFRFRHLMKGKDPAIPDTEPWKHLPAITSEPNSSS